MIHTIEEAIGKLRYLQPDSTLSPGEVLHLILAGGTSQTLFNISQGVHQSALQFLCRQTREISDYPITGGIIHEDADGPYFAAGRKNEFLGTLALAGIHFETTSILTDQGSDLTLADMAEAAMQMHIDSGEEPGWSLMLYSVYPGVTTEWRNHLGELHSVERILRSVCSRPYGSGSCFGTHVIEGVAFAVSRFCLEQDCEPSQLQGVWVEAYEYVAAAAGLMRKNQMEDGSFDRCWFRARAYPRTRAEWREKITDIGSRKFQPARAIVYPTGHCLEALSPISMFLGSDSDWIYSACYIAAQTIETRWMELVPEISALSHAIHALKLLGA